MTKVTSKISREWTLNRREAVNQYIASLQNILRLNDWTIIVDWSEPCEDISLATNDPYEEQKYALIKVSEKLIEEPSWLQTQTLVHEMIHCHLQTMSDLAEYTVKSLSSKATNEIFLIAYNQVLELATDALADAFYPLVPQFAIPEKIVSDEDISLFGSYVEIISNDRSTKSEPSLEIVNFVDTKKEIKKAISKDKYLKNTRTAAKKTAVKKTNKAKLPKSKKIVKK